MEWAMSPVFCFTCEATPRPDALSRLATAVTMRPPPSRHAPYNTSPPTPGPDLAVRYYFLIIYYDILV